MAAFSLRGYWRTFSERIACTPAMTISKLTTMARTGLRMKRSVKLMVGLLVVGGLGGDLRRRRQVVAQHQRAAVVQLEGAARDDGLARFQAGHRRDQVAAPLAQADELLVRHELLVLLLDGEDRVAVRRVDDRGGRNHQRRALVGREQLDV